MVTTEKPCSHVRSYATVFATLDAKMTVEYHASTATNMDIEDSKIGYKQFFMDGSKLRYSGNEIRPF